MNYPGGSPGALRRLDLATGTELQSIASTVKDFVSTDLTVGGLQITDEAFTLNAVNIPVGSLLVFNGQPNTDRVIALDPTDGKVLGALALKCNYDTMAGLYDASSNHLFVLDRSQNPRKVLEIDPADGTVLASFNSPLWGDEAGLAVAPNTGKLLVSSTQGRVYRVTV